MTPPNKSPEGQHNNQGRNHSGHKGRGREHGRGKGRGPSNGPKKFFCHFHGSDSDHTTNFCPEKKRTLERMEEEKKNQTGQPHCMVRIFGTAVPTYTQSIQSNLPTHTSIHLQPIPKQLASSATSLSQTAIPTSAPEPAAGSGRATSAPSRSTPKARATRLPSLADIYTAILRHDHAHIRGLHPRVPKQEVAQGLLQTSPQYPG